MLAGDMAMKQVCYLVWLAGLGALIAYGWSDALVHQAIQVVQIMEQVVSAVAI